MKQIIFFLLLIFTNIFCKKIVEIDGNFYKNKINRTNWFKFVPISEILKKHPEISCKLCNSECFFNFNPFPLSIDHRKQPSSGYLLPTFMVSIPKGIIQGMHGLVLLDNQCIDEMIWRNCPSFYLSASKIKREDIVRVQGTVAVITQPAYENYFHWITEVLGRLALLDLNNISYDYLYVPQKSKFMKETLKMWGISEEKIIAPTGENFAIQADELILPSLVANSNHGWTQFVNYIRPELVEYVKDSLLKKALEVEHQFFSKRIFISRKDAPFRKLLNEDKLFEQLEQYGFRRYELSRLSVSEQIILFNQADIIVSPQGTGLANSIFCNSNTKIIELFQSLGDCTFWYISQIFNLNYIPMKTVDFEHDFFKAWKSDTAMPLRVIEDIKKYF